MLIYLKKITINFFYIYRKKTEKYETDWYCDINNVYIKLYKITLVFIENNTSNGITPFSDFI